MNKLRDLALDGQSIRQISRDCGLSRNTPESIIENLTTGFRAEERETSILIDHYDRTVYFETTHPATARRWFRALRDNTQVTFETHRDSFGFRMPLKCIRKKTELLVRPKYRQNVEQPNSDTPGTPDLRSANAVMSLALRATETGAQNGQ